MISTLLAGLNSIDNPHVFMAYALVLCFGAAMAVIALLAPCLFVYSRFARDGGSTGCTGLR